MLLYHSLRHTRRNGKSQTDTTPLPYHLHFKPSTATFKEREKNNIRMCSCSKLNGSRCFRSWWGAIAQIFGDGRNRQQFDWLWTGVIKQCLNDDNERLQFNETEKLEEKNRWFKCPYESFPTVTCTDWRLSSYFAATRWINDIAATGIWTSKGPRWKKSGAWVIVIDSDIRSGTTLSLDGSSHIIWRKIGKDVWIGCDGSWTLRGSDTNHWDYTCFEVSSI